MSWGGTGQSMVPPPVDSGWKMPEIEPGPAPGIEFGGFGERLVAYIIDIIIVSLIIGIVGAIGATAIGLGAVGDSGLAIATGAFILAVAIVVSIGYFPWFWVRSGQTPGLKTMHMRVVRDVDGGPCQQTGRVEGWEWGNVRRHQKRDLGAGERHGVATGALQVVNDTDVFAPRLVAEDALAQLPEDHAVQHVEFLRRRRSHLETGACKGAGVDRTRHRPACPEQSHSVTTFRPRLLGDDVGDVQAW